MSAHDQGIVAVTGRAHCQRQVAFFNSKTNGENPVKLGCIVLKKSAWKSVYRISDFTVMEVCICKLLVIMICLSIC